jgi:hypothetical protein
VELVKYHIHARAELFELRQIRLPNAHAAELDILVLFLAKPDKENLEALLEISRADSSSVVGT